MNAPAQLHALGQSLWLDNITRDLLDSGTLGWHFAYLSVTGLTSNPTIYDKAIGATTAYDADVRDGAVKGLTPDAIFFDLALADLRRAAELFGPVHVRTGGVDGFVSLEVSPLLAYDAEATHAEALRLHGFGGKPNLFIKIPGTPEGLWAIEDTIFAGVPVNVTLLFSPAQYQGCMEAYTRGIERRVEAGLSAYVGSVASIFISRWDAAVASRVPAELKNGLGLPIGRQAYVDYRRFFATDRWQRLLNEGARPQRLLFASTGTKDPAASASDTLYISGLAAPHTVNTMPELTLLAFADQATIGEVLAPDAAAAAAGLARYVEAGIDLEALGQELQVKGADAFVASWNSAPRPDRGKGGRGRAGRRMTAMVLPARRDPEWTGSKLPRARRVASLLDAETARRLRTIPGVGPAIAATLLAEIGDISRFSDFDQLLAFAGVHPAERSSGRKGLNPETAWHMSKAGNSRLRAAAYRMAVVGVQHNPVIAAHYARKRAAGKSKMNALGHCMRKALSLSAGLAQADIAGDGQLRAAGQAGRVTKAARQVERLEDLHDFSGMLHLVSPRFQGFLNTLSEPGRDDQLTAPSAPGGGPVQISWPPASGLVAASVQIPMSAGRLPPRSHPCPRRRHREIRALPVADQGNRVSDEHG